MVNGGFPSRIPISVSWSRAGQGVIGACGRRGGGCILRGGTWAIDARDGDRDRDFDPGVGGGGGLMSILEGHWVG